MGASRPTDARKAAAIPVWPETQNLFVGAGFIPPGEPCAAAGCGGMGASRPTAARKAAAVPVWPQTQNLFVGAGFIPPGEPCAAAGPAGWGHPALRSPGGLRLSGFAGHVRKVCRGAACPSRGAFPYREHPREGHGPPLRTGTDATAIRLVRNTKFIRRGGFHIRPGPCGDAGFPDDLRPKSRACGLWPPKRACGRSASIVPYRGLCKCGAAASRLAAAFAAVRRGPRPQKQNTTNVPPCRISIAAAK